MERKGGIRANQVIGRLVPALLLLYVGFAYHLVIIEYDYKHQFLTHGRWIRPLTHSIFTHGLFIPGLLAYLRIYLARCGPGTYGNKEQSGLVALLSRILGAQLPRVPSEPPSDVLLRRTLHECDMNGEPLRCWRDNCKGQWKPPRTRHCGDCRTCRPGLDHHCPWFDADVCTPATMGVFLVFLTLVPVLCATAFAPLFPIAWSHTALIWQWACESETLRTTWWSKKRSWTGGPVYRWIIGFSLAARSYPATGHGRPHGASLTPSMSKSVYFSAPTVRPALLLLLAVALSMITIGLLITTLLNMAKGELTIDAQRRKSFRKALAAGDTKAAARLAPTKYFWVPMDPSDDGNGIEEVTGVVESPGVIVSTLPGEEPYDMGNLMENIKVFVGWTPYSARVLLTNWPISNRVRERLVAEAQARSRKHR